MLARTNRDTVLIVDDEPSIGRMVSHVLADLGVELLIAYDAESALQIVKASQPNLVICDVRLPGMDGVEFASIVKRERPRIPVLLISAYGLPVTNPGDGFLAKPFDNDVLLALVQRHLNRGPEDRSGFHYGGTWPLEITFDSPLSRPSE
jgi:CheY-like chemotaxis protein